VLSAAGKDREGGDNVLAASAPSPAPCSQENDLARNSVPSRPPRLLTDLDVMLSGRNFKDHVALMHVHLSRRPLINFQVEFAGIKLRTGDADGAVAFDRER